MTAPDTEAARVAEIAGMLTKAQQRVLVTHDERVHSRAGLRTDTLYALYKKGLLAELYAAGHRFFSWTDLGRLIRHHLLTKDHQNGR